MPNREPVNPDASSSYRRYAKRPFEYSPELNNLRRARLRGDHDTADALGRAHSKRHGMRAGSFIPTGETEHV